MTKIINLLIATSCIFFLSCENNKPVHVSIDSQELRDSGIAIERNQFTSSGFELGMLEQKVFSKVLKATGEIRIPEKSKTIVSTLISGTIGRINLVEGQWVNKGERLFTITNPNLIDLQEDYLIAYGQLEYLREEYSRQMELLNENLTTKKDVLRSKSELKTTEVRMESIFKKLSLYGIPTANLESDNLQSSIVVLAPISGYVSELNAIRGKYLEPNQSALTLINTSQIYLELSVLEKDALLLEQNQKVTFSITGGPEKEFHASIYLINKMINENNTISAICKIEDVTNNLVAGMYVKADITLMNYTVNALPESAVVKVEENYSILSLNSRDSILLNFDKTVVNIGQIQDGYIEILDSLDSAQEFLTRGGYYVLQ